MQPAVAGVDDGVEQDGDADDEVVPDEAKRWTRTIWHMTWWSGWRGGGSRSRRWRTQTAWWRPCTQDAHTDVVNGDEGATAEDQGVRHDDVNWRPYIYIYIYILPHGLIAIHWPYYTPFLTWYQTPRLRSWPSHRRFRCNSCHPGEIDLHWGLHPHRMHGGSLIRPPHPSSSAAEPHRVGHSQSVIVKCGWPRQAATVRGCRLRRLTSPSTTVGGHCRAPPWGYCSLRVGGSPPHGLLPSDAGGCHRPRPTSPLMSHVVSSHGELQAWLNLVAYLHLLKE
jgi:hypothetical protein